MLAKILISLIYYGSRLQDNTRFLRDWLVLKIATIKKSDNFLVLLLLVFIHNSSPNNNTLNELYLSSLSTKTIIYYTRTYHANLMTTKKDIVKYLHFKNNL